MRGCWRAAPLPAGRAPGRCYTRTMILRSRAPGSGPWMAVLGLLWCAGCTPVATAPQPAAPAAFGGERAAFGEAPGAAKLNEGVGRCQNVPALDSDPLLADFEQDSIFLRPVPDRYGV